MQKNTEFSEWQLLDELNIFFNYNLVLMNEWLDTPIPRLEGQCPREWLQWGGKLSAINHQPGSSNGQQGFLSRFRLLLVIQREYVSYHKCHRFQAMTL